MDRAQKHTSYILTEVEHKITTENAQSLMDLATHAETRQLAPLYKLIKTLSDEYSKLASLDTSRQLDVTIGSDVQSVMSGIQLALATMAGIDGVFGTADATSAIAMVSATNVTHKINQSLLTLLKGKITPVAVASPSSWVVQA